MSDTPGGPSTELQQAAKKAYLLFDQLGDLRRNARHIQSLDGIAHFIKMVNRKTEQVRAVLQLDADVVETLEFLEPIDTRTDASEYPSAIIDGKRGQFMVISGVLRAAIKNFMRLYMSEIDKQAFDIGADFFTKPEAET